MNENIFHSEVITFLRLYASKGEKHWGRNQKPRSFEDKDQKIQDANPGHRGKQSHDDGERKFQDNSWSRKQSVKVGAEDSRKDILRKRQVDRLPDIFLGKAFMIGTQEISKYKSEVIIILGKIKYLYEKGKVVIVYYIVQL